DSWGTAALLAAASWSAGPAGRQTLSSRSAPGPSADRRYRPPGGSHTPVPFLTGMGGTAPEGSRPRPAITNHSSPPGAPGPPDPGPSGPPRAPPDPPPAGIEDGADRCAAGLCRHVLPPRRP